MEIQKENNKKTGHTYLQWMFALLDLTFLAYGMDCGWISPFIALFKSDASPVGYPLTDTDISWISSILTLAAVFGVYMYSIIADKYGRKICVILIAVFEAISWIIRVTYTTYTTLMIARILSGLSAAGCYGVVPIYVKEISQDDLRGILGTFPVLFQNIGIFVMYIIGAYLDYDTVSYIVLAVPIIAILAMLKAPESPAFLLKQDKINEANETVALLTGRDKRDSVVQGIIETMTKEKANFENLPDVTLQSILKNRTWRYAFILIMLAFTFMESNGAYAIITYASHVISLTGVQFEINPEIQSLSFPIVMTCASLMLLGTIERIGRKPILLGSFLVSAIGMLVIAVIIILQKEVGINVPSWLPIIVMTVVVALFAGGVCPLSYIIMTEMLNFRIRAKVMGVVITYGYFLTFVTLRLYAPFVEIFGEPALFIFYGLINAAGTVFTMFWLTETKGKNEEEILQIIMKNKRSETDEF